ncbi:MAG TPA: hypothetical protein DCM59_06210 [Clostridium sp.]|nr:hypothetical protein [Clostridium sp.]
MSVHHIIGKVIKEIMIMNTNITEKRVLEIVESFNKNNNLKLSIKADVQSINFHNQFHRASKDVWVVKIKIDLMGFEGTDIINLVISDKNETVDYWLYHNGIPQMFYVSNY